MFYKYLRLILLSTVLLQASPKLFNGYGNQMESFQKDCKEYQKVSLLPKKIKKKCKVYNSKVNRTFKFGYKLDSSVDKDNINLDKAEKYNAMLHSLEDSKSNILSLIKSEIVNARKVENIKYYKQLIIGNEVKISLDEFLFMKDNESKFKKHPQFILYQNKLCKQEMERLREAVLSLQTKNEKAVKDFKTIQEETRLKNEEVLTRVKKALKKAQGEILSLKAKDKAHVKNKINTKTKVKSLTTCKQDMVYASSSAENATDYALKGNHKYALIEVKEAIVGTEQALESCKGKVNSGKMDELSKNLSSLYETKKLIQSKLSKNSSSSSTTIYTIIKDDNMRDIHGNYVKRSVEVSLSKRVSPDKLKQIAYAIKQIDKTSYKRTFIGYYLSDTDSKQRYWATTHFNPNLEVQILGLTIEEEKALTQKAPAEEGIKIIGSWMNNDLGWKYTLLYKNETLLLRVTYKSGGSSDEKMLKSDYRGMQKFNYKDREAFGEHFVINSNNELEFRNSADKIYYRAKLLK